jgi:hypothetical protein
VLGTQQLIETAFQLVSRNDAETMRILRDDIILLVNCNPRREELTGPIGKCANRPAEADAQRPAALYQKYTGTTITATSMSTQARRST